MFALTMEYVNHHGDDVMRYLPVFSSLGECEWFRDWFLRMLETDHATKITAICRHISEAPFVERP
jgi:hypothetical protein